MGCNDPAPRLETLYLYITDHCNLSCGHCWLYSGASKKSSPAYTSVEAIRSTVEEAMDLGLEGVKITGGEPYLHPGVESVLDFLAKKDLAIQLETNGTLLTRERVSQLGDIGLPQVSVSLDAAVPSIHDALRGRKGSFEATANGIRRLTTAKVPTQIIMTLQKANQGQIDPLIRLSEDLGVASLKIGYPIPCGRAKSLFRVGGLVTPQSLLETYRRIEAVAPTLSLPVHFDIPPAFRSPESLIESCAGECRIFNILGVLANGDISICGIGQTINNLKMGNIAQDSIGRVWRTSPILENLRTVVPRELNGICGNCIHKFSCLGVCRAAAYATDGNLAAPYFLCQAYAHAGLFPASRTIDGAPTS
jgi:SynChlorMet cassette radical SAM/SPASM protein ScmF